MTFGDFAGHARSASTRVHSDVGPSLVTLVSRFVLRRRAGTSAFTAGVFLAAEGAVTIQKLEEWRLHAHVNDEQSLAVELIAHHGDIRGYCACRSPEPVCRHQVAAAHALWLLRRPPADEM